MRVPHVSMSVKMVQLARQERMRDLGIEAEHGRPIASISATNEGMLQYSLASSSYGALWIDPPLASQAKGAMKQYALSPQGT